jgi:molybdate transport system substrate-binding protein
MTTLGFAMVLFCRLSAEEITVFAAASLSNALTEIGVAHEKATGDKVVFNFAGTNTLVRQIEAGAPADLFISADEAQMDVLAAKNLIDKTTRKALLGNTLVIVTAPDGPAISKVADLAGPAIRRFSAGDPKAVPAGVYAKKHLEKLRLWEILQPKLMPAENVRAALTVVESGNAEAGIVYKTDASLSKNVKVALEIPAAEGPQIVYPVALVSGSRHAAAAGKFLARLTDKEAGAVFTKLGFTLLTTND